MGYARKNPDDVASRFVGVVKLVRNDLGSTAFGAQVLELRPNAEGPRHDQSATGQQEFYVNLDGSGWIAVDGELAEPGRAR
jgi:hypothetical protein